mmetsp:Transcript_21481/g.39158  ORF Transcript_21481/g.39158 Transcript_21481/m.39158 type:complete len:231 (+) Transcript_21481:126-818(+)
MCSPAEIPIADRNAWEARFRQRCARGVPGKDWYCGWPVLRRFLTSVLSRSDSVLVTGCGDAPLALEMYKDGFERLTCVDYSPAAIKLLCAQFAECNCNDILLAIEDVTNLSLKTAAFNAVLDKGCFDALPLSDGSKYLSEVQRVLLPGGHFVCVTNCGRLLQEEVQRCAPSWEVCLCHALPISSLLVQSPLQLSARRVAPSLSVLEEPVAAGSEEVRLDILQQPGRGKYI